MTDVSNDQEPKPLPAPAPSAAKAATTPTPVWCVVANAVYTRSYGPGGIEKRPGLKHFPGGAKLHVVSRYSGDGGLKVTVVGRHRGSHHYVCMDVAAKDLANWRVELVYSPHIICIVREQGELSRVYDEATGGWFGPDTKQAREAAEAIVAEYVRRGAATQPYVSRPPTAE